MGQNSSHFARKKFITQGIAQYGPVKLRESFGPDLVRSQGGECSHPDGAIKCFEGVSVFPPEKLSCAFRKLGFFQIAQIARNPIRNTKAP